jgi:hypothetical protein
MDWFQHIYENNYVTIVAADAGSNEGSLEKKVYQLKQELEPTFFLSLLLMDDRIGAIVIQCHWIDRTENCYINW